MHALKRLKCQKGHGMHAMKRVLRRKAHEKSCFSAAAQMERNLDALILQDDMGRIHPLMAVYVRCCLF